MKQISQILGTVFLSVIIVGAGGYFALPFLYPSLNETGEYLTEDEGILLQSKFQLFNESAIIPGNQLTILPIPGTTMNFTIRNNSKITIVFSVPTLIELSPDFIGFAEFCLGVGIEGVGNATALVQVRDHNDDITDGRQHSDHLYIYYETEPLSAGTYQIHTYYYSRSNTGTQNFLTLWRSIYAEYPRSLLAHELKTV